MNSTTTSGENVNRDQLDRSGFEEDSNEEEEFLGFPDSGMEVSMMEVPFFYSTT